MSAWYLREPTPSETSGSSNGITLDDSDSSGLRPKGLELSDGVSPDSSYSSSLLAAALARPSLDSCLSACQKGGPRRPSFCLSGESIVEGRLTQCYKAGRKIGKGSMSIVYSGTRRSDGGEVALKTMQSTRPEVTKKAEEEYELLRQLRHPCIVHAWDLAIVGGQVTLVLERCKGGTLVQSIHDSPEGLGEADCSALSAALATALDYLHGKGVVHCDVQPGNLMVSRDPCRLKLLGFGAARQQFSSRKEFVMPSRGNSVLCLAPEVVLGEHPSPCSDVWQLGLCVYYMLSGHLPQGRDYCEPIGESVRIVARTHVSLSGPNWKGTPLAAKALLRHCLSIDKLERPTSKRLLSEASWLLPALRTIDEQSQRCSLSELNAPLLARHKSSWPPSTAGSSTSPSTGAGSCRASQSLTPMAMPKEPCSEVEILEGKNERATILVVNYAERTYKVRFGNGRVRVVRAEDVRLL